MVADILMSESDTFVDTNGMLGVCGVDPAFEDLVQRLTTSPASSASIERVGCSVHSVSYKTISGIGWVSKKQASLSFVITCCMEPRTWTGKL